MWTNELGLDHKHCRLLSIAIARFARSRSPRGFLTAGEVELAASLSSDIRSQSGNSYNIKPGRISQYERGLFEPNLLVLVAYARLAKVHLEFVIDDRFTLQDLRKQLG